MRMAEIEDLLERFSFAKRIAFVAFCAERCLGEARRLRPAAEQLPAAPVEEAIAMLWTAAAEETPDASRLADVEKVLRRAASGKGAGGKLHPAVVVAAQAALDGFELLADPESATPDAVADLIDGPCLLVATLYASVGEARSAEKLVLERALDRLRGATGKVSSTTFDGIEDWPRTTLAPRYAEPKAKPPARATTSDLASTLAAASDDERARLVKQHGAKLAAHLPRLYMTDPADTVRDALHGVFLRLGRDGRRKVAVSLAKTLSAVSAPERARALEGIRALADTDAPVPPAKVLVALVRAAEPPVRAAACSCLGRLAPGDVDDAVREVVVRAFGDEDAQVRFAALEAIHHARRGLGWAQPVDVPVLRALAGVAPEGGGRVDAQLLEGLVAFVRGGTAREQEQALEVVAALGPHAVPIAVDVAHAFATADKNAHVFGPALRAMGTLPEEARPLLEAAAQRSAGAARHVNELLEKAFGARIPLAERIAQIEGALASRDHDARLSALMAARDLPRAAAAALPVLLAHGAKVVARLGDGSDASRELAFTRDALRALGCPPDELPHAPSRLEAFRGSVPSGAPAVEDGYVVATFSTVTSDAPVGIALGSVGVWDDATGKLLFVVDGAEHLRILSDRGEAVAVRAMGPRGPGGAWFVERFELPTGRRLASLPVHGYAAGWPTGIDVATERDRVIATVGVGDEDGRARFRVALGRGSEPDALLAPAASKSASTKPSTSAVKKAPSKKASPKVPSPRKPASKKARAKK